MKTSPSPTEADATSSAGFSTIDEKGRVSLPKAVRAALGVHPGSSLAYIVLDNAVLFVPQDEHLAQLQQSAAQVLTEAGLTVQDLLDYLPQAREEVMREAYSSEFLAKLKAMREAEQARQAEQVE